jgi:hypothetical protein
MALCNSKLENIWMISRIIFFVLFFWRTRRKTFNVEISLHSQEKGWLNSNFNGEYGKCCHRLFITCHPQTCRVGDDMSQVTSVHVY